MDLDDLIEDLLPKKQLKKIKKKVKKTSLLGLFSALVKWFTNRFSQSSSRPQHKSKRPERRPEKRVADIETVVQSYDEPLLANLAQARQYSNNIEAMALAATPNSMRRSRLDALSERVADWVVTIEQIVEQTLAQSEDELLSRQKREVPIAIKRLEKQQQQAKDANVQAKLERTLMMRRKQLAQLEQASANRQLAELKVESTLAQLGTIYTQLHSGHLLMENSGYERLSAEISDEVHTLEDYLHALNDLTTSTSHNY